MAEADPWDQFPDAEPKSDDSGMWDQFPAATAITEPQEALPEDPYAFEPTEAIPTGKPDYNIARGAGERGSTLLGNLMQFAEKAGEFLESDYPLGGFAATPGAPLSEEIAGYKYLGPDEYKAFQQAQGSTNLLDEYGEDLKSADFGYEQHQGWDLGKEVLLNPESSFGDKVGAVGDIISWGFETGAISIPDMIGAVAAPPAYLASRTNEIAEERAVADGRSPDDVTPDDMGIAAVTATAVTILERFGAQKLLSFADEGAGGIIKGMAQGGGTEALTEAQQELVEYLGAQLGTEQGVTFAEGLERTLQGMVGGGSFGAPAGGVSGAVGKLRTDPLAEETKGKTNAAEAAAVAERDIDPDKGWKEVTARIDEVPTEQDLGAPAEAEIERPPEPAPAPPVVQPPPAAPEAPIAPEAATEAPVVADQDVVPETAETIERQIEVMNDPETERKGVYLPPGSPVPEIDTDTNQIVEMDDGSSVIVPATPEGNRDAQLLNLANQLDEETKQTFIATLTGIGGEGKTPGAPVVTVRDPDGTPIQDAVVDPAGEVVANAEQLAEQRDGTVEVTTPEAVTAERVGDLEAGLQPEPLGFQQTVDRVPPTPAVAESMAAVDFALQEFNTEREALGPGRKPTGNPEQRASADAAWLAIVSKLDALAAEGYDIEPLRKILRKAAGNRAPTVATASNRSGSPIGGRIQAGEAGTKRAPKGGWGTVLDEFYTGLNRELNRFAAEGPTKIPQAVTPQVAAPAPAPVAAAPKAEKAKKVSKKRSAPAAEIAPAPEEQVARSPEEILEAEQEAQAAEEAGIDTEQQLNTPEEEAAIVAAREETIAKEAEQEAKLQEKIAQIKKELAQKGEQMAEETIAAQKKAAETKPVVMTKGERAKQVSKRRSGKKITLKKKKAPTAEEAKQERYRKLEEGSKALKKAMPTPERPVISELRNQLAAAVDSGDIAEQQRLIAEINKINKALPEGDRSDLNWLRGTEAGADIMAARDTAAADMQTMIEDGLDTANPIIDQLLSTLAPNDPLVPLLNKLQTLGLGNVVIQIKDSEWMKDTSGGDANGLFSMTTRGRRIITLNKRLMGGQKSVKVFAHELIHAVTAVGMSTDNDLAVKMNNLRKQAIQYFEDIGAQDYLAEYGLTNVDEFIAEAMTNPNFQRALAAIEMDSGKTSLWTKFIDAIADFLGIDQDGHTMLSEVVSLVPDLMMTASEIDDHIKRRRAGYEPEFIRDQTEEGMDVGEEDFLDWMLPDQADKDNVAEVTSMSDGTIGKGVANLVRRTVGKVEDVTKMDLSEMGRSGAKALLGFMTQDQIIRRFKNAFQDGNKNSMQDYDRISRTKTSIARSWQKKAEKLNKRWGDFEKKNPKAAQAMAKLMQDSTLANVHIDKAFFNKANKHMWNNKAAKKQHERMKAEFNALPAEGRAIYRSVRDSHAQQKNDMRNYAMEHLSRSFNVDKVLPASSYKELMAARTVADVEAVDLSPLGDLEETFKESMNTIVGATQMQGPYFPLRRFGDYVVEGTKVMRKEMPSRAAARAAVIAYKSKDPTNKAKTVKEGGKYYVEKTEREVSMFETEKEANEARDRLNSEGFKGARGSEKVNVTKKDQWQAPPGTGAATLLSTTKNKFDQNPAVQKALDTAFIEMLLDSSIRKSELQRKNVKGASPDMRRGYAERSFASSWAIADLATSIDHHQSLVDMKKTADASGDMAVELGEAVQELKTRDESGLADRKTSIIDAVGSKFGFLWYLFSPSYAVVNATQVPLVALPYLSGKFGTTKASAELFNAYSGIAQLGGQEFARIKGGLSGAPENLLDKVTEYLGQVDPEAAVAIKKLTDLGIIDATFMQELYETSRGVRKGGAGQAVEVALDIARGAPQIVEIMNRVVVARAAYNLAKAQGSNQAQATEAASEAVLQTQFDYSDQNKPRYFKGFPGARAIMMFKMYGQGMYALILSNAMKGLVGKAKTKAERNEARRILAGVITTHSMAAGVLGGVAMEPVRAALWLFYNAWADDEDEMDLDRSIREFLAEYLGNDWAEVIARGLPRAIGLDLSGRVGLDNMAMMGMRDSRSVEEGFIQFIISLGGPILAAGQKVARGLDYLEKGETTKAVENMTPKFMRDALKTWRMYDDGMTDYNGNTILGASKMDNTDLVYQALGFTPAITAETYESRRVQKRRDTKLRDKRKRLMQMWRRSENSPEFFREVILPFNQRNRDYAISVGQLFQSKSEQRRKERKTFGGAYTDKRETRELADIYNTD